MREKRGRRGNRKTLDPVGEDGVTTGKEAKGFFACYLLTSLSPRHKGHTYIGFTVNPRRRIRQHNGEITCGALRTKRKRPWEMVLCIYGFPTNISALQFEWAWQHPRESLAVREAAAAFKSFSGFASKIKLAYTMLNLPAWNSLNLTVNYFSSKYAHIGGQCPRLPLHMKVQVCAMDDLSYFTEVDNSSHHEDEESPEGKEEMDEEEEEEDCSDQSQPDNRSPSSLDDLSEKELHDPKEPLTVVEEDRLANFTGFGLLGEFGEDVVSHSPERFIRDMEKEPEAALNDRLTSFTGFGLEDEAMDEDCRSRRRSPMTSTRTEVEVIDLLTPSPSCRDGSSRKRRRVSEFIDLTMSPNFIEL